MEMSVNLDAVKDFVENKLPSLLLENTTDFAVAAFVLQSVLDAIDSAEVFTEDESDGD